MTSDSNPSKRIDDLLAELAQARSELSSLRSALDSATDGRVDVSEASLDEDARQRLSAIQETGVGVLEWDIPNGTVDISSHWFVITGHDELEGPQPYEFLRATIHPVDVDALMGGIDDVIAGRAAVHVAEHRLRHQKGHWVWVVLRCVVSARDEDQKAKRLIGTHVDITERKRAEDALRESESRFRVLADGAPVVLFVNDPQGGVQFVNRTYCKYFGITPEQVEGGKWRPLVHPDDSAGYVESFLAAVAERAPFRGDVRVRRGDGEWRSAEVIAEPRRSSSGEYLGHVGIIIDLTERRQAERERARLQNELFHAQKLESVGRLAGGVAHDFNNMLAVILGSVDLALLEAESASAREHLLQVQDAAERSAELTGQLLAFARRQPIVPRPLAIGEAMGALLPILSRLIGENVELVWQPDSDLWRVKMDAVQFDQVLTNLCINAKDSMASVGQIRIAAANCRIAEAYRGSHGMAERGDFVRIEVSDDGCGMSEEELVHLFEPFFTTKAPGKGTGLGLATVYGAVQQNNGFIEVTSTPGAGATFRVFLPRLRDDGVGADNEAAASGSVGSSAHGQTILVVEDEPSLSRTIARMLETSGYRVLSALSPSEAIRLAAVHGDAIDLLLTDVVMPEMNGRDLAKRLRSMLPGLKQLFMSGYTADIIAEQGFVGPELMFIEKPFSTAKLTAKIREVLGRSGEAE